MKKSISITCKTGELIEIAKLERFQGDLKEITTDSMDKLKASIIKYGFSFPIFVWQTKILDGHQRLEASKQLIKEGYILKGGKLPVVQIEADSDQEAAEKLLLINSRYAQITQAGFDAFVTDFEIDLSGFSGLLEIPELSLNYIGFDGNDKSGDSPWERIGDKDPNTVLFSFGQIQCNIDKGVYEKFFNCIKSGDKMEIILRMLNENICN